jgi:uncharacterized protein YfaT (DUF1175 family)
MWSAVNVYGEPVPFYPWETRLVVQAGADKVRIVGDSERDGGPAKLEVALRARDVPGSVILSLWDGGSSRELVLRLLPATGDRDADGIPDAAELADPSDRRAFRDWFTAIAEAQFYRPDPRWAVVHRDCAGLARFAYKEALRQHDRNWLARTPYLHRAANKDVRSYNYPDVPVLGERIFRTLPGAFSPEVEVERAFSHSASARVLWEINTVSMGKSATMARPGDMLFFRDPDNAGSPMHSMILLDPPEAPGGPRVVYHTGGDEQDPGEVRLVKIADLNSHRDDRWHVRSDNPHFLGYFRWKILEGGRP